MLKEGDIVRVDFTATDKERAEVFDTTSEKKAVEAGIFKQDVVYQPLTMIIGSNEVIPELEKAVQEMKVGETKQFTINSSAAFGDRRADLVKVVPLQEFKNRNIQPFPGLIVELNEMQGRVQSVTGGRVRVDFNHPLAGKTLEYEVKVVEQVTEKNAQVHALVKKYLPFVNEKRVKIAGSEVSVELEGRDYFRAIQGKPMVAAALLKYLKDLQSVKFTDEFKKEEKGKKEK